MLYSFYLKPVSTRHAPASTFQRQTKNRPYFQRSTPSELYNCPLRLSYLAAEKRAPRSSHPFPTLGSILTPKTTTRHKYHKNPEKPTNQHRILSTWKNRRNQLLSTHIVVVPTQVLVWLKVQNPWRRGRNLPGRLRINPCPLLLSHRQGAVTPLITLCFQALQVINGVILQQRRLLFIPKTFSQMTFIPLLKKGLIQMALRVSHCRTTSPNAN